MRLGIFTLFVLFGFFLFGLPPLSAQVNVTKTDSLIHDANNNMLANPGDSLRYKTNVKNPGAGNVTGATMDINASSNLNMNPATFRTTPVAVNDTFAVTGNIGITVDSTNGLKPNDFDDDYEGATLMPEMKATTNGDVTINADGSFTYIPDAGFTGTDEFTYTLLDGNTVPGCPPSNDAIVLLNVAAAAPAMIWFIDNTGGGSGGTGTLTNPFKTIADFNASLGPQPGHIVFLENTGTNYTGPINLKNNQTLWGSGHTGGSTLADLITEAPNSFALPIINTTRPIIDSATDGIFLAMGNSIRGLNIGNCTDFGIDDNGGTVGALTISELNITNASGGGFRAANGGGTLAVTLGSLSSTGGPGGIHLGSCGGFFNGGTGTITSPNGIAVNIAGGTVGLTYSGNITQANNFAMVSVSGGHTTGTVTFQTGTLNATNGTGLQFNNADSPTSYNFLGTTTLNGGAAAVNIINGSAGAFTFGANTTITSPTDTAFAVIGGTAAVTYSGSITQANNFPMVSVSGGHTTGTITFQTGTLNATNGTGLQFNNADSPMSYNFNGPTTLNGGDAGIDILNGSAGTFTFGTGTSITNPSGNAINIGSSTANVTYSGTFTKTNNSVTGINITSNTGGTIAFNGTSTKTLSTGSANAVNLTSNGGTTINFSGNNLSLTTTSGVGFNATGGGTVNVTGTGNIINSSSGIALNVTSTTIGASNLNFQSISSGNNTAAADPVNGIVLNSTGSGRLIVTGGGNASVGGDSSGGTIQNITGVGISLTNTLSPSFTNMNLQNIALSGVNGVQVTNFTFNNGTINNVGTAAGVDDGNITFNDNLNTGNTNITGIININNNILNNSRFHGVDIRNDVGAISNATISGNSFTSAASVVTSLGSAVRLVFYGNNAGTTVGTLTKATLNGNTITNFPTGAGFVIQANTADVVGAPATTLGVLNDATNIIAVTNNLMNGGSLGIGNQPDRFITAAVNGLGQGNFNVSNNGTVGSPITNIDGVVIEVNAFGNTDMTATINNNIIVSNNAVGSSGINLGCDADGNTTTTDDATVTGTINGNTISGNDGPDIYAIARGVSTCTLNVAIKNNTCAAPATTTAARAGIRVDSGSSGSNTTVCLDISGNTTAGSTNNATMTTSPGINLRRQTTGTCVFGIEGMAATSTPGVENFVNAQNTSASGTFGVGGTALLSGTTNFSNCSSAP